MVNQIEALKSQQELIEIEPYKGIRTITSLLND
jgi:hypothetical protein